jgi:threonine aldolase
MPLLDALTGVAHTLGLATHLDGARLFDAVVASGVDAARRCAGFDTVAFCFSKGLGAPVGSVLCADRDRIAFARRMRKLLGGGMRQSGLLAAAALYALEHHVGRLADDHRRAAELGRLLADQGWDVEPIATNMVYVRTPDAAALVARLAQRGVWCFATAPDRVRLVLHLDIDDDGVVRAARAFGPATRAA